MSNAAIDTKAAVEAAKTVTGILPQAGKTAVLDQLVSDMTSEALKALSPEARAKLLQVFAAHEAALQTTQEMVDSYKFDEKTGVSTFTVPAGVTDVEAMKALNEYFRKHLPNFGRDAVFGMLDWYETLPERYPTHCQKRDYSQARQITITGVVKGTAEQDRTTQGSVLRDDSLVFSDPRDQAIAAALHACKHDGQDLFEARFARCSVPGVTLATRQCDGVSVYTWCRDDSADSLVVASGTPSPELK